LVNSATLRSGFNLSSFWENRRLIARLARRELEARYRGSLLGTFWIVVTPILLLAVYTFTFRTIFKARWSEADAGAADFALFLFAGLIVFNAFSETINRSPTLLLENVSYIKRVVFPLEILPVVILLVALCNLVVGFAILLLFHLVVRGLPPPTILLFPLPLIPLCLLTVGLSWFLAATGLFLRDIRHVITVVVTMLMFLSPVFFPVASAPEGLKLLMLFNPLAAILEETRGLLLLGRLPPLGEWLATTLVSAAVAALGLTWFLKTRRGFADVV
jgi:lipopolysaccharide transport system permease protein